jgi:hypothetical protein
LIKVLATSAIGDFAALTTIHFPTHEEHPLPELLDGPILTYP